MSLPSAGSPFSRNRFWRANFNERNDPYTPIETKIVETRNDRHRSEDVPVGPRRRRALYAGRFLSGLVALFLTFDAMVKILMLQPAVEGTTKVGFPAGVIFPLGVIELLCLAAYLTPRFAPLGAIVWTGYLGGAVATHVRMGDPLASHILAPVYVAALLWAGLWLRDRRVRALLARTVN